MLELRIHGYGGQGAVTLAHLLATAALNNGFQGQALPSFGVERRGAPVKAVVRISQEMIRVHSQSVEPDILVLMSEKLFAKALSEGVKKEGVILYNGAQDMASPLPAFRVDADAIATEANLTSANGPFINIPLLGACCKVLDIPAAVLEKTLLEHWPGKTGEKNFKAALAGYEAVKKTGGETA